MHTKQNYKIRLLWVTLIITNFSVFLLCIPLTLCQWICFNSPLKNDDAWQWYSYITKQRIIIMNLLKWQTFPSPSTSSSWVKEIEWVWEWDSESWNLDLLYHPVGGIMRIKLNELRPRLAKKIFKSLSQRQLNSCFSLYSPLSSHQSD